MRVAAEVRLEWRARSSESTIPADDEPGLQGGIEVFPLSWQLAELHALLERAAAQLAALASALDADDNDAAWMLAAIVRRTLGGLAGLAHLRFSPVDEYRMSAVHILAAELVPRVSIHIAGAAHIARLLRRFGPHEPEPSPSAR